LRGTTGAAPLNPKDEDSAAKDASKFLGGDGLSCFEPVLGDFAESTTVDSADFEIGEGLGTRVLVDDAKEAVSSPYLVSVAVDVEEMGLAEFEGAWVVGVEMVGVTDTVDNEGEVFVISECRTTIFRPRICEWENEGFVVAVMN